MENKFCTRIKFNDGDEVSVLLGLIIAEDDQFITLKTSRRTLKINKNTIITTLETQEPFREVTP